MLGREEDAQEAYKEAALVSEGVAAGSFAKALASLKAYDEDLVAKMEEAVRFLQLERGESHKISYSIQRCHSSATIEDGDCAPLRLGLLSLYKCQICHDLEHAFRRSCDSW